MTPIRVILIGGFLGAGKTTLIGEIVRRLTSQGQRVGVITNDQTANLVDTELLAAVAPEVGEVAGACFCCSFDHFISELTRVGETLSADLLIAEPVGSCTDLSATVVRPLKRYYADLFHTSPYSVLVDPGRFREAFGPPEERSFPDDVLYIYRLQIEEADAILLNKCDQLSQEQIAALVTDLQNRYPNRPVFAITAATGAGVTEWLDFALGEKPSGQHSADVDYDRYARGEAALGWLNAVAELTATAPTDWPAFCRSLLAELQHRMQADNAQIAHAKIILTSGREWIAGNLVQNAGDISIRGEFRSPTMTAAAVINARAHCSPPLLQEAVVASLRAAAGAAIVEKVTELDSLSPGRPNPTHPPGTIN